MYLCTVQVYHLYAGARWTTAIFQSISWQVLSAAYKWLARFRTKLETILSVLISRTLLSFSFRCENPFCLNPPTVHSNHFPLRQKYSSINKIQMENRFTRHFNTCTTRCVDLLPNIHPLQSSDIRVSIIKRHLSVVVDDLMSQNSIELGTAICSHMYINLRTRTFRGEIFHPFLAKYFNNISFVCMRQLFEIFYR